MSVPAITLVSPVRDVESFLPALLAALDVQTLPRERFEAIFVDDGSRDATADVLRAWADADPERRRVLAGPRRGPAAARNVGVAAARAPWVAFTDGDVLPEPDWLERLLAAADGADAVEGKVVPWPPEDVRPDTHWLENERGGLYVTANMAYRRDLLDRLGGFDESFEDAFLEDSDLAFRALDGGASIVFAADAVVRHRVLPSTPFQTLRATRKLRWLPLLASKHPQRYRGDIRPHVKPVSRREAQVLLGLAGLPLLGAGGLPRLAGALLALVGARGVARSPRLAVPARQVPAAALFAVVLPLAKAAALLEGTARFRFRRRT